MALRATAGLPSKGFEMKKADAMTAVRPLKMRSARRVASTYRYNCLLDDYAWRTIDLELRPIGDGWVKPSDRVG